MAGFILSACVGAVNLPAGTIAESKTEKTDETIAPKSIIIDDKEPAHPCIATPFRDTCGGEEFNDARETICLTERESHRCLAIISAVCESDSLDTLCNGDETYFAAQRIECEDAPNSKKCASILEGFAVQICGENPFDDLCDDRETYFTARKKLCEGDVPNVTCRPTIVRACRENPFYTLCSPLHTERKRICTNEPNSERCAPTIKAQEAQQRTAMERQICPDNPFDELCGRSVTASPISCYYSYLSFEDKRDKRRIKPDERCDAWRWYDDQVLVCSTYTGRAQNSEECVPIIADLCRGGANSGSIYIIGEVLHAAPPFSSLCDESSNQDDYRLQECNKRGFRPLSSFWCQRVVPRICDSNPLNVLCEGRESYFSAQETACTSEPNSERCYPTLDRVCGTNVFSTLCQLSYLKLRDFPEKPNTFFRQGSGSSLSFECESYTLLYAGRDITAYPCYANYPSVINIKPLNDTNTGTATYVGSLSLKAYNIPTIIENIDIIADFDNNTLSYSGNLDSNVDYSFSINGRFTDRGQITGSVDFRSVNVHLIGLIGQEEAIGVFATAEEAQSKAFAGGFTATRE